MIVAELEEIRTTSDQTYDFFGSATAEATISVQADDGLAFDVAPQHRESARALGNGVFELKQTLLPGQVIRVRWWEKTDMEAWLAENEK